MRAAGREVEWHGVAKRDQSQQSRSQVRERKLNSLLKHRKYAAAEKLCREWLVDEPWCHWILCQLAYCVRRQDRPGDAIKVCRRALRIEPKCPLARWEMGVAYEELGQFSKAIDVFRSIIRDGVNGIVAGPCNEGTRSSRGIVADSMFATALCWQANGRPSLARAWLKKHLTLRKQGAASIVDREEIAALRKACRY